MSDATHSHRIEEIPALPVGADGYYETYLGASPPPWSLARTWEVQIIHARGVACTQVQMPWEFIPIILKRWHPCQFLFSTWS